MEFQTEGSRLINDSDPGVSVQTLSNTLRSIVFCFLRCPMLLLLKILSKTRVQMFSSMQNMQLLV